MSFPNYDKYWAKTADFILKHIKNEEDLLAPIEFEEKFPGKIHPYSSRVDVSDFQWAIVHKGMIEEIDPHVLKHTMEEFVPVFANEVFVVFSSRGELPEFDASSPHIRSFREKISNFREKVSSNKINETISNRDCVYLGDHRALSRTIFGQKIYVDTRDISLAPHILLDGYWEMWITRIIMNTIKEGMNVIEIGANIGYYSLLIASKIGDKGKLFIFEPNPNSFEILFSNIEINGFLDRVELINKAVMDKPGRISFNKLKRHHGSSSIISFTDDHLRYWKEEAETIMVEAISLDEYFRDRDNRIDMIKIDTEGSEPYIFDGMKKLIKNNPNIIIICEFIPHLISGAQRDPKGFLEEIQQCGFSLRFIDTNSNLIKTSMEELLKMESCDLYLER